MNRRMPALPRRGVGGGVARVHAAALLLQLLQRVRELPTRPPVTVGLIALQILLYMLRGVRSGALVVALRALQRWTSVRAACLHPRQVLATGQRYRLVASSLVHASDLHLMYNMTSFLYKGVLLEDALGSCHFFALVVFLSFVAHVMYVCVAMAAYGVGVDALMGRCVVGFSGVLFGLKVVLDSDARFSRRARHVFGVRLPGGMAAACVELVLAQIVVPNASFLGHLTGIGAGFIYVYLPKFLSRYLYRHRYPS